jgi:signal transduction histidine kinase
MRVVVSDPNGRSSAAVAIVPTADASKQQMEGRVLAGQLALESIHEIKNPLDALGNLAYLAYAEAADPEKVRTYMLQIEEQLATLNVIISQTLDLARSSPSAKHADLAALAGAGLRVHRRTIDEKKIHLVTKYPEDLVAEAHPGEILQVLSNLIANALDALPVAGTLTLRMRRCQRRVHIVVSDNGRGISPEHAKSIFEPFFTTKGAHGTGLGLAICRQIIERHRGKISVRSSTQAGRAGTTFMIFLPE